MRKRNDDYNANPMGAAMSAKIAPQSDSGILFAREQFRMTRLQVYNWGTFSGLHNIPIAERGFLFVGRSGAGKSTLLDAFSALLVPPRWIDFNAAAREADRSGRDRNLVSYIRGAWAEQKDGTSGEITTTYLRPGTTWSALALSYCNALGQVVVLVQVFWLRGNVNGNTDVKRYYLIFERLLELRELESFAETNFDIRRLKQSFPDAFVRDDFTPYRERFCGLLGIESEMALRLLHKTQSAKNLGDLNTFLRDFMLDKPETFEVAQRLVNEFGELNAAHQAVVTARQQVQTLIPARVQHQLMESLQLQRNGLKELQAGVDNYSKRRRIELLESHITALGIDAEGLEGEERRQQETLNNQSAMLRDLERQHRELGGDQIEQLETEKTGLETQRADRLRKQGQAAEACKKLGWALPDSPKSFADLLGMARDEIENGEHDREASREQQFNLSIQKRDAEENFKQARKEVEALQRQPSNIPATMLEMRRDIAAAIGIAESALPFVGELIEVKPDHAPWQGAIERVLHGFALSLLVDERHYTALTSYINRTHLGRRLVYYRTGQVDAWQVKPIAANSLFLKLNLKDDGNADWLRNQLRQRFDYACTDSVPAFRSAERAVTIEGQVKHSKTVHEKDDRSKVDDRRNWVLGFDNREKLAIYAKQAQDFADAIVRLGKQIDTLGEQDNERARRAMQCQSLVNLQWQEIDLAPLLNRIAAIEKLLRELREGNTALRQISERIGQQKIKVEQADKELRHIQVELATILKAIKASQQKLESLLQDPGIVTLTPWQSQGLDERFARLVSPVRLETLDQLTLSVVKTLNDEVEALNRSIADCENTIEKCFTDFKREWAMEAGDMQANLASAPDYFAKLARLESDGLPAHEQRFFDLLRNQSHQNMIALMTHLNLARKSILERMDLVNNSLSEAEFSPGTYLQIDANDRQLPEVREFKQEIHQALEHAWSEEREFAESRFLALRRLVERLGSQDPEQKRWRESVLDVRQHVEFVGREIDSDGNNIQIHRSGAGKSGGQRQKLATTCLAAALRYQLGGHEHGVPMYAPVILDEAFDKADNEFTALAMNIFANFGFQMIVATPLKSVMTLEPFIGGACFVDIAERHRSSVLLIEYDGERQRLKLPERVHEGPAIEAA